MTKPVWLEAALNGPWSRSRQRLIPITVAECVADGIACARAGAAVIHVHAYDPHTGLQNDDAETYVRIIEGIRAVEDVIVYPTLPLTVTSAALEPNTAADRFSAVEELCRRGLLEWAVVDPGSLNLTTYADVAAARTGPIYLNPEEHIRTGLKLAQRYGFVPSYAIYEPGFTRLGAALARSFPNLPAPVYRFMFTTSFTFGFPPEPFALRAHLELLHREAPAAEWMAAGLGVDITPLIPEVVAAGGHVRVGLEDSPLGTDVKNAEWVDRAAKAVVNSGGRLASSADVRSTFSSQSKARR
ncbi:MAG TPA: 3-keto-5-aminohexanoate cleavage protein [Bradyrhizobium sp.]|nr:3-keto-5-aminohexanoate cleavage protein [Bradyrhizobium sp.]